MNEKVVNGVLYKIGDEVVILDGKNNKWGGRIHETGHRDGETVYSITSITDKGFIVGETTVNFSWWVDFDNVKHVSKFKPGDLIIMTDNSPYGITVAGAIGTIEYVHGDIARVKFRPETLQFALADDTYYSVSTQYMRHYNESEIPMTKAEFKIGDKVRVSTGDWNVGIRVNDGDIGEVISAADADDDFRVEFGDDWFYVPRAFMTLVNTSVSAVDMVAEIKAIVDKYGAENVKRTVKFLGKVS